MFARSLAFRGAPHLVVVVWLSLNAIVLIDWHAASAMATDCSFDVQEESSGCSGTDTDCAIECAQCGNTPPGVSYYENSYHVFTSGSQQFESWALDVECKDEWTCTTYLKPQSTCISFPTGKLYCDPGYPLSNCYECIGGTPMTMYIQDAEVQPCSEE